MPRRNSVKEYAPDSYYHVYNRGVNKRKIFIDTQDYTVFLNILKRYLDIEPVKDNKGREYESFRDELELLAFCLMPNHFHLLIYQYQQNSITKLMRAVCNSYTGYFNKKYRRVGPLFQSIFKANRISSDEYIQHISRYIHLNPGNYKSWEFSSYQYYIGSKNAGWLKEKRILAMFGKDEYGKFVADYEGHKKILDEINRELADF